MCNVEIDSLLLVLLLLRNLNSILGRVKSFSLLYSIQTDYGAHPAPSPSLGREADHSPTRRHSYLISATTLPYLSLL
jgi:hypothetical protein